MKTPYDILGVRRNASDATIRAAFRKAAKAYHPDLNPGDQTAEQRLIQVIAAYRILKSPPHRAAYDQYLRQRRRERAVRFAVDGLAALVGASVASLAVWLWASPSNTREASKQTPHVAAAMDSESVNEQLARTDDLSMHQDEDGAATATNGPLSADLAWQFQQSAGTLQPAARSSEGPAPLAKEWQQVQASRDPKAIWAFAVRHPDAPESALARSKLVALIDTAEDVSLLQFLRLVATDAIAERAWQRLNQLSALAVAKEDSVASGAPSSNPPPQATLDETIKPVIGEPRADDVASGAPSSNPPLQAALGETIKPVVGEPREDSVASDAPSSNPLPRASLGETIKPVIGEQSTPTRKRESPAAQKTFGKPRIVGKRQTTRQPSVKQASSENRGTSAKQGSSEDRRTSACAAYGSCSGEGAGSSSGSVAPLFGVGF